MKAAKTKTLGVRIEPRTFAKAKRLVNVSELCRETIESVARTKVCPVCRTLIEMDKKR